MLIVPPRRMTSNDVSDNPELSGGTPVGPLQSFAGVGRGDHGWGHSRTGVSGRRSRNVAVGGHEEAVEWDGV